MKNYVLIFVFIIVFLGCTSTTSALPAPETPKSSRKLTPVNNKFIAVLRNTITQDTLISDSGRRAVINLYPSEPTLAFPRNEGLVLEFRVFDYSDPVEARQTAALLLTAGAATAREQQIALNGIQVVFYEQLQRIRLIVAATPPWKADQIFIVPLGRRGD